VRSYFVILVLLGAVSGCGGAGGPTTSLEGAVTLDGAAIQQGQLSLVPMDRGQAPAASVEFSDGRYTIPNAPLGKVRAYITATRETGKMIPGDGRDVPEIVNIVPGQYRSGIEIEVKAGDSQRNFDLVTEK
jgi:hypothetical protein